MHWPTLGLGILAFAIMISLRRINPKIPNVLVAVVVTTIISLGIGLEHNHTTSIENVESRQFTEYIELFDSVINEIEYKSRKRVELGDMLIELRNGNGNNACSGRGA